MARNILVLGVAAALLIIFVDTSLSIDFRNLADQSSYRCPGGIVAIGDLDRSVREKCGEPLEIARRQDVGPIWIYYNDQSKFMHYLAFTHGNLQRIVSASCTPDNPDCFDLR
jgi:hypothetical protein